MKNIKIICIGVLMSLASCRQENITEFEQYFTGGTIRIDYFHTGDAKTESVELDQIYSYDAWAGSRLNLIDSLDYGSYYYKIYDPASGALIYSKGFNNYFEEYQLTDSAINGQVKQFQESAIMPFPKSEITFVLERRNSSGGMKEVFKTIIDPAAAQEKPIDPDVRIYTSLDSGNPSIKADIAIIGEGYTAEEEQKFQDDLKRFTEVFFKAEPCKSNKDKFNIRGVLKPSEDSGIDEPRAGIDKNTAVGATFNSLGSERYVLTEDNKSLRDIAGHVPYDALYVMVNSSRYGGGGIYNFYCVFTSDNVDSEYLMVHEFGHSFFGLADEYYTSSTAYNEFYKPEFEPNEPNVTALKDPANVKWKHLVSSDIAIPTPWAKAEFDSLDLLWQQQRTEMNLDIAALQLSGADSAEITEAKGAYDARSAQRNEEVQAYLAGSKFAGKVGAFEGAGYATTGLYRPSVNCIMFTRTDFFCPVCREAMTKVINSYAE